VAARTRLDENSAQVSDHSETIAVLVPETAVASQLGMHSSIPIRPGQAPKLSEQTKWLSTVFAPRIYVSIAAIVIITGWLTRDANGLHPNNGLGRWLGFLGGLTIFAALIHSWRSLPRNWSHMQNARNGAEFQLFLGVVTTTVILFHANFLLGALTSTIAMISLLSIVIVETIKFRSYSNIFKITKGKISDRVDFLMLVAKTKRNLFRYLPVGNKVLIELESIEALVGTPSNSIISAIGQRFAVIRRLNYIRPRVARAAGQFIRAESRKLLLDTKTRDKWKRDARNSLDDFVSSVSGTSKQAVSVRLIGILQLLQIPLVAIMLISIVLHVVAVHFY
jgi:hypothetical protein